MKIKILNKHNLFEIFQTSSQNNKFKTLNKISLNLKHIIFMTFLWLKFLNLIIKKYFFVLSKFFDSDVIEFYFVLFGILCNLMRSNWSMNFQTFMDLYLYQEKIKKRVFNTLCKLDFVISYFTIQRQMNDLTDNAQLIIKFINKTFKAVII